MPKHVYPKSTGWYAGMGDYPVFLNAAEPWDATDPLVKAHPEAFGEDPEIPLRRSVPVIEQATAAPGENRDVSEDDLDALRGAYKDATGETADKRWGTDRLRQEIENA